MIPMEREERLRRRREQYRARRDRESEEERHARLERCREYERRRYAAMNTEQRRNLTQRRRERTQRDHQIPVASETQQSEELVDNQYRSNEIPAFDHPSIIRKVTEFHSSLMTLTSVKCTVCLENFPTLKVNTAGICTRCDGDKHSPKLYSPQNNMDPGPVPPQLRVSY